MAFDKALDCDGVASASVELPAGISLFHGQYRVGAFLNGGGFGLTYLAQDGLGRDVVLKECFVPAFSHRCQTRVSPRPDSNPDHLQKVMRSFHNEARMLARLSHPNIVHVHQVFEDNGTAYMALEYIKGHDLLEIVDEGHVLLTPGRIVAMARKLVSAVAHVHDRQLLHCDISPDNVCIRSDGEPVLIDFGSARSFAPGMAGHHGGFTMVKDGYSPPELYASEGPCGPQTDIYALGATLYHAISGSAPVDGQSRQSFGAEARPDPLRPLAGRFPGYPPGFLESVDKAMAVHPAERHASAQGWLRLLTPPDVRQHDRNVTPFRPESVQSTPARQQVAQTA
ncbi:MAG: serine/threonine-protein kinase [Rhodobacterales bacterium]|nr:serine/threonine-protein kinase [Rhodobacterales bacterium]